MVIHTPKETHKLCAGTLVGLWDLKKNNTPTNNACETLKRKECLNIEYLS